MYKVGGYARCIDNDFLGVTKLSITLNKIYEIEDMQTYARSQRNKIGITNDEGDIAFYEFDRFELADKPNDIAKVYNIFTNDIVKQLDDKVKELTADKPTEDTEILQTTEEDWSFGDDTFQPTKSHLIAHKDEYAYVCDGSLYKVEQSDMYDYDESLVNDYDPNYDITAIYKLTKVWERDPRRELTIEEVEKEFNVRVIQ